MPREKGTHSRATVEQIARDWWMSTPEPRDAENWQQLDFRAKAHLYHTVRNMLNKYRMTRKKIEV